jgi:acetyl esterase
MRPKLSKIVIYFHWPSILLILGLAASLLFSLAGFAQVAGPGSDDPRKLPGQPVNPAQLPRTSPAATATTPASQAPIDPQVKAILDKMEAAGVLHPTTREQARKSYLFYAKFAGSPENIFHVEDRQIPGPAGNIPVRLYQPRAGGGLPVWVYFHGGGFITGSLDTHDTPLRAIANRCDCVIVSVAYRLAPEHPYPAATQDAYAATKWAADHATEIGGDPLRIAVGGDGAGGNLAAVVTLMARDRGAPHLDYQVLIYPILDSLMLTRSWVESHDPIITNDAMLTQWAAYVPVNTDPNIPYISPANADLHKLPPALIVTAADDPLRDEDNLYALALRKAATPADLVVYPDVIHGFFLMGGEVDAAKKCSDKIAASLKQGFQATPQTP